MGRWQKIDSKIIYDNNWITLFEDNVINPAGQKTIYSHLKPKSDSICVIPIDDSNNTYLVKQHRYVTNTTNWECPAGKTDGQTPIEAAKRELFEETGIRAGRIETIGEFDVANGTTAFKVVCLVAYDLELTNSPLDQSDGIIECKKVPLDKVIDMIMNGEIVCGESIACALMVSKYLENKSKEK